MFLKLFMIFFLCYFSIMLSCWCFVVIGFESFLKVCVKSFSYWLCEINYCFYWMKVINIFKNVVYLGIYKINFVMFKGNVFVFFKRVVL